MKNNVDFVAKLRNSGLRPTKQRIKICEVLFGGKDISIMPEFTFFHEISGQTILSKKDYEKIEKSIKFKTQKKIYFDYIDKSKAHPSAFVWHLKGI